MSYPKDWGWKEFYTRMIADCVRHIMLSTTPENIAFWQDRLNHYCVESKFPQYKKEV